MTTYRYTIILEREPDGGYHAYCPALKGCHSWGATRAEARQHIKEAIELWLDSAKELGVVALTRRR